MGMNSTKYTKPNVLIKPGGAAFNVHPPGKSVVPYVLMFATTWLMLNFAVIRIGPGDGVSYNERLIFILLYLVTGAVHIFIFPKWLPHIQEKDLRTGILYTLLLALISAAGAYLLFTFNGFHIPMLALASACAFLLPAALQQLWTYFDFFSSASYPPWLLPASPPLQKKATIFLNSLEIRIKIKLNYFDVTETTFMVTAPGRALLGSMFHGLLLDGEAAQQGIQLTDEQLHPYAWQFFLQKPLGIVMLNPEFTLAANKVKQKDTILAERIKMN